MATFTLHARLPTILAAIVGSAVVACAPAAASEPEGLRRGQFLNALVIASCDQLFACATNDSDTRLLAVLAGDPKTCVSALGPTIMLNGDMITAYMRAEAGELRYDALSAEECLAQKGCGLLDRTGFNTFACRNVFYGETALNEPCSSHEECAGADTRCEATSARTCPGTCAAAVAVGGACAVDRDCSTLAGRITPVCDGGQCKAANSITARVGEECGELRTLNAIAEAGCELGSYCDRSASGPAFATGICAESVAAGTACTTSNECPPSQFCIDFVCGDPPIANHEGDSCLTNGAAPVCNPLRRLRCNEASVCELVSGPGFAGQPCVTSDFSDGCAVGNFCDPESRLCAACTPDSAAVACHATDLARCSI